MSDSSESATSQNSIWWYWNADTRAKRWLLIAGCLYFLKVSLDIWAGRRIASPLNATMGGLWVLMAAYVAFDEREVL